MTNFVCLVSLKSCTALIFDINFVFLPVFQFRQIFLPRRAVTMSVEEPDMKKLEILIFSNDANKADEAFKILKDYISNEKPCTRQVSYFYLLIITIF